MVNSPTREAQTGLNILGHEVGEILQHLIGRQATGQEIENVGHPDTHPTDARAPPALLWIHRDSLLQLCHSILLVLTILRASDTTHDAVVNRRLEGLAFMLPQIDTWPPAPKLQRSRVKRVPNTGSGPSGSAISRALVYSIAIGPSSPTGSISTTKRIGEPAQR